MPGLLPGARQDPVHHTQATDHPGQERARLPGAGDTHAVPRLGRRLLIARISFQAVYVPVKGLSLPS